MHILPLYSYDDINWQYLPENHSTFEETLLKLREYWDDEHLYAVQTYIRCVVLSEIAISTS